MGSIRVSKPLKPWWTSQQQWARLRRAARHGYLVFQKYRAFGDIYEMGLQYLRKQLQDGEGSSGSDGTPEPCKPFDKLPALWEFLAACRWDDGTVRETGTILVWFEDGKFRGMLRDRHFGMVAFVTGQSFEQLLKGFDSGIQEQSLEWRSERRPGKGKGNTRK